MIVLLMLVMKSFSFILFFLRNLVRDLIYQQCTVVREMFHLENNKKFLVPTFEKKIRKSVISVFQGQ